MKTFFTTSVAALFISGAASAATTTLFDDDFAAEVANAAGTIQTVNFDALQNWTITDGTVDLFNQGGFNLPCGSEGCLDLDGSSNNAGRIETNTVFTFIAGATYTMSVDFSGRNGGSQESLSFGIENQRTLFVNFGSFDATDVTETLTFSFATGFMGSLFIDHDGGDSFGMLLDRVTLTETTAAVPLPAAGWLLLAGLGGIGMTRKRRS